jgi:hypothetical protein
MSYKAIVGWVCVAVLSASCAQTIAGTPTEQKIDVSQLDTGLYRTQPKEFGQAELRDTGEILEAIRMAEATPDLASIGPTLIPTATMPVPSSRAAGLAKIFSFSDTGEALPVLRGNGMVAAYAFVAGDADDTKDGPVIVSTLIRFPDDASADRAASELEAADFAVNPNNVSVPIPEYPNANAHWQPGIASMSATLAEGDFVMHVVVGNPTPNLGTLVSLAEKIFGEQIRALGQFKPTPIDKLVDLPFDQDGVLRITLDVTPDSSPDDSLIGVYGPRGGSLQLPHAGTLITDLGIDRVATLYEQSKVGGSKVVRLRDEQAARDFVRDYPKRNTNILESFEAPDDIPGVQCFELKEDVYGKLTGLRYECFVRHGRYVAIVSSAERSAMPQLVAAQYVLLTNDPDAAGR